MTPLASDHSLPCVASAPLLESPSPSDVLANPLYNLSITQFCQKVRERVFKNAMANTHTKCQNWLRE